MTVIVASLGACYSSIPAETDVVPAGESVILEINDRGRVALAERFGPALSRVEGRLTSVDGNDVVINVTKVAHVGGERSQWSGESVRLSRDYVARTTIRRLSTGKTVVAAGVAAGALVYFIASKGLVGKWFGTEEPPPVVPPASSRGIGR